MHDRYYRVDLAKNMLTVHGIDQDSKRLWLTPEYHELGFLS